MKKYFNIVIAVFLLLFSSCEDWLDLTPENKITEDDLYSDGYGFRTNLNGLYLKMASNNLYGFTLAYEFIDVLSDQYDLSIENIRGYKYDALAKKDFKDKWVVEDIEAMWDDAYNIIANANNILKNIENKGTEFFKRGEMEKNMIEGEALAVRAFMHFDLLRLFAPALVKDDNGKYIPYVKDYPCLVPNGEDFNTCISNVIEDLERAKELTISFDTTDMGISTLCDGNNRFLDKNSPNTPLTTVEGQKYNDFFKKRGYRFNYYTIHALLARVYQYAGQHEKALEYAEAVMDFKFKYKYYQGNIFKFKTSGIEHEQGLSDPDEINSAWESKTNLKLYDNLIFATYTPKNHEEWGIMYHWDKSTTSGSGGHSASYYVPKILQQKIFFNSDDVDESMDDVRFKYLIYPINNGANLVSGKYYPYDNPAKAKETFNITPLIRLTEMYYIAAESYARAGDFPKAKQLLQYVRSRRGCNNDITVTDWDNFQKELIIDARREWISEGQLFYLYKRLNAPVDKGDNLQPAPYSNKECVLPMPDNQSV